MTSRFAIALAFALAVGSGTGIAAAQSQGDALLREGVDLRRQGRDADALASFRRAYELDRSPIALAQMGLAEQALGDWVASEAHVRTALEVHGNPWLDANRTAIEQAYATIVQHVGTLEIEGLVDGAEVRVNDRVVGRAPLAEPVRVAAGNAVLAIRADGYRPLTHSVAIAGGTTTHETVAMERAVARSSSILRPLAYAAAGGAVVGVTLGIVGIVAREGAVTEYNDDPVCPGRNAGFEPLECRERIDRAEAMRAMQIVGFVSAGVFAAASVALWFLSPRAAESHATHSTPRRYFACGGGPGAVGIACTIGY